jgi:acyl-CoA synthetase (AMP-forming)/AMP-acid ligase II
VTVSALLERYYSEGHWHAEPLWHSFRRAARAGGEVVDGDTRESLAAFLDRASRIAAGFAAAGLVPGDTILVQSRNRADAFAALLACFAAGYVAAPLPPIFSVRQVAAVARSTRARGYLLFDGDAAARPRDVTAEGGPDPVVFAPDEAWAEGARPWSECLASEPRDWPGVSPDVPAFVMHSSGSMGDPKGVVHSGNSLRFSMRAVAKRHRVTAGDRVLVPCEFGFVGGTVLGSLLGLLAGASVVLMRKWDATAALELIAAERITYSLLMPTHCHDVLRCPALDGADMSTLSRAIMAGITHADRRDAMRRFTPAPLSMFGMSESIGHATPGPDDPEAALLDTDGRTLDGAETLIIDADGRPCPAGTPGELLVRGPNRLLGYLGRPDLTAEAISPEGWFRTGDRAVVDALGFFTFIGREKDIIRRGGVTILPSDVENVLRQHPDIGEISVVSVPDDRLGEKACACIVPRAGANPDRDSLAAYLQTQDVARYLWPEHVLLFEDLPRTASLKVRRADLRSVAIERLSQPNS